MRRIALALLLAVSAPLFMAAAPFRPAPMTDADRAELDAISAYLNAMTTLKGGFYQIEPSGNVSEGTFYISKPGKMRFEYKPPNPTLLVSDGSTVAVANRRLATIDRYSLSDTPLRFLLADKIDIRKNPHLKSIAHQQGSIVIAMTTSTTRTKANMALVFSEPGYELRQWTIVDDQGLTTTVALRDVTPGVPLAPELFTLPDKASLRSPGLRP